MITPEQALRIKAGLEAGTVMSEIGKDVGVAKSTVERVNRVYLKKGKFSELLEKSEHMASLHKNGKARKTKTTKKEMTDRLIANMKHLRAQGLSLREIS